MTKGFGISIIIIGIAIAAFAATMPAQVDTMHYACDDGMGGQEIVADKGECSGYAEPVGEMKAPNQMRLPVFGIGVLIVFGGFAEYVRAVGADSGDSEA